MTICRTIQIRLARVLWRLARRIEHFGNALFNNAHRYREHHDDRSLLRMLVSGTDGEVVNSISALRLILSKAGLDIYAVIERIELSSVAERQKLYDVGYDDGRIDEAEEQRRKAVTSAPPPSIGLRGLDDDEFDDDVGPGINGFSWRDISQHLMTNLARIRAKDQSIVESVYRGLFLQGFSAPRPKQARWIRDIFIRQFAGTIS